MASTRLTDASVRMTRSPAGPPRLGRCDTRYSCAHVRWHPGRTCPHHVQRSATPAAMSSLAKPGAPGAHGSDASIVAHGRQGNSRCPQGRLAEGVAAKRLARSVEYGIFAEPMVCSPLANGPTSANRRRGYVKSAHAKPRIRIGHLAEASADCWKIRFHISYLETLDLATHECTHDERERRREGWVAGPRRRAISSHAREPV